jgi:lariat debranching enzyme
VKFSAVVRHGLRKEGQGLADFVSNGSATGSITRFLSLDKCLPQRDYLQIISVPTYHTGPLVLEYDEEWLAITRVTHPFLNLGYQPKPLPLDKGIASDLDVLSTLDRLISALGSRSIPQNFEITAVPYDPSSEQSGHVPVPNDIINPQMTSLLAMLGLEDLFHSIPADSGTFMGGDVEVDDVDDDPATSGPSNSSVNPEVIDIDIDLEDEGGDAPTASVEPLQVFWDVTPVAKRKEMAGSQPVSLSKRNQAIGSTDETALNVASSPPVLPLDNTANSPSVARPPHTPGFIDDGEGDGVFSTSMLPTPGRPVQKLSLPPPKFS